MKAEMWCGEVKSKWRCRLTVHCVAPDRPPVKESAVASSCQSRAQCFLSVREPVSVFPSHEQHYWNSFGLGSHFTVFPKKASLLWLRVHVLLCTGALLHVSHPSHYECVSQDVSLHVYNNLQTLCNSNHIFSCPRFYWYIWQFKQKNKIYLYNEENQLVFFFFFNLPGSRSHTHMHTYHPEYLLRKPCWRLLGIKVSWFCIFSLIQYKQDTCANICWATHRALWQRSADRKKGERKSSILI